jgi:hypothetical protein
LTTGESVVPSSEKEWLVNEEALHAFNTIKYTLTKAPVLIIPDFQSALDGSMPFRVQTDASEAAMGAVLMQDRGIGWQPVAFASKAFCRAEFNYSVTEKELRALVWATCEKFRHYLYGTHYELQGDHKPLRTLLTPGREVSPRKARWVEMLQENNVPQMTYVPGATIPVPDTLSRRPDYMRLIPTARETLEKRLQAMGVNTYNDLDPGIPLHTVSTEHSMPSKDTLVPAALENAPLARTTEESFPGDQVSDPTADTPLPVGYGQTGDGLVEAWGEIASGIKAFRPRLQYRGGSIIYPDGLSSASRTALGYGGRASGAARNPVP